MTEHLEATVVAIVVAVGLVFSLWAIFGWGVGLGVLVALALFGAKAAREDREKADERRRKLREAAWRFQGRDLR